jgi:hypothetical protein
VCDKRGLPTDSMGVCFTPYYVATTANANCHYTANYMLNGVSSDQLFGNCSKTYVQQLCAQHCPKGRNNF